MIYILVYCTDQLRLAARGHIYIYDRVQIAIFVILQSSHLQVLKEDQ